MSALDEQMKKHDLDCNVEMRALDLDDCDCGTREAIEELADLRQKIISLEARLAEALKRNVELSEELRGWLE